MLCSLLFQKSWPGGCARRLVNPRQSVSNRFDERAQDFQNFVIIGQTETRTNVSANPGQVTLLLQEWKGGSKLAESRLFEILLPDLRRIAGHCFANERAGHTLQPTALVNEAFIKLVAAQGIDWQDRGHFFALAARVMRRYLIDRWRSKPSVNLMPMEGLPAHVLASHPEPFELATALDILLEELALESHQQRAVVELKFFLGFTDADAADALNLPLRTFQREWLRARRWLFERLTAQPCRTLNTTNE
jgi:RNA polymerase sigma-70 factor (ECF subfamily)